MRALVTGGAGFVGASVCLSLAARNPDWELLAFDNLKRRGSELNLPRLREAGITFIHGDVREPGDLMAVPRIDALVECSAEPSVLAGYGLEADYVVRTNLLGAYNCLELARRDDALFLFLSTSRVYPVEALNRLELTEAKTRFELGPEQTLPGVSPAGISEAFPLDGARTLYGTTKLAGELLAAEYAEAFGLRTVIDRCGVIAGPWQMGKVDQGVFTHWVLSHHFGRPLRYIGYGGAFIDVTVPPAGIAVTTSGDAPVEARIRQFAGTFPQAPLGTVAPRSTAIMRIPERAGVGAWHLRLTPTEPVRACGLRAS